MLASYALSVKRRVTREKEAARRASLERFAAELEVATDPEDAIYRHKDLAVAKLIGSELVRQYPGHGWQVVSDIRNGIAKLYNMHISGQIGWMLKLKDLREVTFSRDIQRIGGEMLERSGLSRGRFNELEVLERQRDSIGRSKVDLS